MTAYLVNGSVVRADYEALRVHVQDQILTHDGQANECDIGFSGNLKKISIRFWQIEK